MANKIQLNKETDFKNYAFALGESFTQSLQNAYLSFSDEFDNSTENKNWVYISSFLKFISEDQECDSTRTLCTAKKEFVIANYELITWQIALDRYRQLIHSKDVSLDSKQDYIVAVRLFFCDYCSALGLIPKGLVIKGWLDEANFNTNSDDFIFFIDHRKRDFNPYRNELGDSFVLKLVDAYTSFSNDLVKASEVTYWHPISNFLRFVCENDACKPLKKLLKQSANSAIDPKERYMAWQAALQHFRHFIDVNKESVATKSNNITGVRKFFCDFCANFGVTPHNLSLKGWRIEHRLGAGSTFIDDEISAILGKSKDEFALFIDEMDKDEDEFCNDVSSLVRSLFSEESSEGINKVQLTTTILSARLDRLKSHVSEVYIEYIKSTDEMDEWLSDQVFQDCAEDFERLIRTKGITPNECVNYLGDSSLAFPILAVWFRTCCDLERIKDEDDKYYLVSHALKHHGWTQNSFDKHLGRSLEGLVAGYTFILLETAANPESIRNLTINDLVSDNGIPGTYSLKWMKLRASGSEAKTKIFNYGEEVFDPEKITVMDVFAHQLKCRNKKNIEIKDGDQDKLFLNFTRHSTARVDHNKRINMARVPSMSAFNIHLENLSKDCSDGQWEVTSKSIRGSMLLLEGLLTKDYLAVAELGQHTSLAMPKKYTNHLPEKIRVEEKIRDFLGWFEALLTVDIENFAQKIGIDEELYAKNREEAKLVRDKEVEKALNQQFGGIHCSDPYAGTQNLEQKGSACTEVSNCPTCPQRRGVFLATEGNVVNIMHWHQSLEDAKAVLSEEAFAPWMLWHSFTTRILERLKNSREHKMLFKISERKSKQQSNSYQNIIKLVEVN